MHRWQHEIIEGVEVFEYNAPLARFLGTFVVVLALQFVDELGIGLQICLSRRGR